jgi:hypothetical protein
VGVLLEADARRAVELADDDALGAVDDERAALGHHRDLAHVAMHEALERTNWDV